MPNRLKAKALVEFKPEERRLVDTGDVEMQFQPDDKTYTQAVQSIGTVEENLGIGDVANVGLYVVINRDETNYVEIGLTGSYTIKLKPGQFCVFPPNGTITAVANTNPVDIEYYIFPEDT